MKSRHLIVMIIGIAVVAAYYIIGTDFLKQRQQGQDLEIEIADATAALNRAPAPPTDLDERLEAANNKLAEAAGLLPQQFNTTRIVDDLLREAENVGIKAIPLSTRPWTDIKDENFSYSEFRVDLNLTGPFTGISDFVEWLETGEYGTLIVKQVNLERIPGTTIERAEVEIAVFAQIGNTG